MRATPIESCKRSSSDGRIESPVLPVLPDTAAVELYIYEKTGRGPPPPQSMLHRAILRQVSLAKDGPGRHGSPIIRGLARDHNANVAGSARSDAPDARVLIRSECKCVSGRGQQFALSHLTRVLSGG